MARMARTSLASTQLAAYMLDKNLRPEALGAKLGLSHMTIRRAVEGKPLSDDTKWRLARELGEEPSTLWPPMPGRRQPGGSRHRVAA
jgi:plasmid maintenance system antidote protein VapI